MTSQMEDEQQEYARKLENRAPFPRDAQGQAYAPCHDFGWALNQLRGGFRVRRAGWNGKGMFLELQKPDANSKMKRPYIFIVPGAEWVVPWVASQADLLSTDWEMAQAE